MADLVTVDGIGFKRRNPWGVFGLSVITFGIYYVVWWYKINNELRNYGIENSPAKATLALTLGAIVIVPPFITAYKTAERIKIGQEKAGSSERMTPVLGLILLILFSVFGAPYYQSQINKIWDELAKDSPVIG